MSITSMIRTAALTTAIAAGTFTAATTATTTTAEAGTGTRIHISIGGGYGYGHGYYRPYHGGGCYWLKVRAMDTGSGYWWSRYRACRHGW
jgi:hypothetical protein